MSVNLTIIMYHYVRDLRRSRYPRIKGLDLDAFRGQLEYLARHYQVIDAARLLRAVRGEEALPPRAAFLTFDDGYLDHFTAVMPLLVARKWSAAFFPVASTVTEHRLLDVNKIHFVLAATPETNRVAQRIISAVESNRARLALHELREYQERCRGDSRYDSAEVTFIKRMLQRELPEAFRAQLIDDLFREFVTADESAFAAELYMNSDQLRCMLDCGMSIGSHGVGHYWMNTLTPEAQRHEVDASLEFLATLGVAPRDWLMCYPYGGYNESLLEILRQRQCALGFSVRVGIARAGVDDPLTLPRLDTNDLPVSATAAPTQWTAQA